MEFQNGAASLGHVWFQLITYHVDIEFRYIKFLIPVFVQLLLLNKIREFDVLEPFDVVFLLQLAL